MERKIVCLLYLFFISLNLYTQSIQKSPPVLLLQVLHDTENHKETIPISTFWPVINAQPSN